MCSGLGLHYSEATIIVWVWGLGCEGAYGPHPYISADSKKNLQRVVRSAGRLAGDITFTAVADIYRNKLATKSLRMVASELTPMLTLTQCPSGRYSTIRYRVNLRKPS